MERRALVAMLTGLLLAAWFSVIVAARDGNPSTLLAVGRDDVRVTAYVMDELGPAFVPQEAWGHDGKFVFIQAHDPFLLDPDEHAARLDTPVYRSQRVLVPALAGAGAVFGPWGVVWAFPALMVVAVTLGAWATAGLAERAGRSAWWGMAFVFNPGLFYSYRRGTVDVVAVALLMLGVYLVVGRKFRHAGLALAGAVLAKEVMILGALGMAVHKRGEGRRILPVVVWPLAVAAGWGLYVRLRLGASVWSVGADAITAPFTGVARVLARGGGPDMIVALVVLGLAVATVAAALLRPSVVSSAGVGFALLLPLLPEAVWGGYTDAWRAAAPLLALLFAADATGVTRSFSRVRWVAPAGLERETEPTVV